MSELVCMITLGVAVPILAGIGWSMRVSRRMNLADFSSQSVLLMKGMGLVVGIACLSVFLLFSALLIGGVRFGITEHDGLWYAGFLCASFLSIPGLKMEWRLRELSKRKQSAEGS